MKCRLHCEHIDALFQVGSWFQRWLSTWNAQLKALVKALSFITGFSCTIHNAQETELI